MSVQFDNGPLAWVKSEIDASLERAGAALRAFGGVGSRRAELGACRAQLHQAAGAVQIVGLEGVARLLEESEHVVGEVEAGALEATPPVMQALERALDAVATYLGELLDGASDEALRLYPEYCALTQIRGESAPPEADLYFPDLSLRPPPRAQPALRLPRDELEAFLRTQCGRFQRSLVRWLREPATVAALAELRDTVDEVEKTQVIAAQRAFWWAAGALFDALAQGALADEPGVRQVCTRVEQQLRRMADGSPSVAERLQRELLYWVARAGPSTARADEVRRTLALPDARPQRPTMADISQRLTLARGLRESIGSAKQAWSRFAAGVDGALTEFAQTARAMAARAERLDNAALNELAAELERAARELQRSPQAMSEAVAMEVATALLLLENAAENYRHLGADFAQQADLMRSQLHGALSGGPRAAASPAPPLLAEMSRRAEGRLAMGAALAGIQGGLRQIEQTLDAYGRDPQDAAGLTGLDGAVQSVASALAMIGEDEARAALESCAQRMRAFGQDGACAGPAQLEEVAQLLSGLGFYIEALGRGAKADFAAFLQPARGAGGRDASAPSVELELEDARRAVAGTLAAWRERPQDAGLKAALRHKLETVRDDAALVADAPLTAQAQEALAELDNADSAPAAGALARFAPAETMPDAARRLREANAATLDREVLAVFLEEAAAVLAEIAQAVARERAAPGNADLAVVRRAFHTLKGSGRTVGLARVGDTAAALEQVVDLHLQQGRGPAADLLALIEQAHAVLAAWLQALPAGEAQPDLEPLVAAARRVAQGEPLAPAAVTAVHASPSLFAVFSHEARGQLEALEAALPACMTVGEVSEPLLRAAHTLAGICGTVQIDAMQQLASALERVLRAMRRRPAAPPGQRGALLGEAVAALRAMYAEALAQGVPAARGELLAALNGWGDDLGLSEGRTATTNPATPADGTDRDAAARQDVQDAVDAQMLPLFLEEAQELAPRIGELLGLWRADAANPGHAKALQRALHTFKGSARMAGAFSLGELAHQMEERVESARDSARAPAQLFEELELSCGRVAVLLDRLRRVGADTQRGPRRRSPARAANAEAATRVLLRVPATMLEKLVNDAGEVAIARTRVESELRTLRHGLAELAEFGARLREQLRDIEIQAEAQLPARLRHDDESARDFDPLEFERYTRVQELTRMTAESVDDVLAVRHNLTRALETCETALAAQARLNREVQQDLMRIRTVPVGTLAERLHGLVRQVCAELGKQAELELRGADVELDRSVLERITGPLEHLLRNAVTHGIEAPEQRSARGKPPGGAIRLEAHQGGSEVSFTLTDDGAGLDLDKIRARALELGLLGADEQAGPQQLAELIFAPGLSTAARVTEVAGRGVGTDVVKSEVSGLGGRIEVTSSPGQGTRFIIRLPLTSVLSQVVLVRSGARVCALPAVMVEQVEHPEGEQLDALRATRYWQCNGRRYPLAELAALLGEPQDSAPVQRPVPLLLLRAGADALALQVDELLGNQEVVCKKLGSQLARVPGVAGVTVLGGGEVVLILNPVPLAKSSAPRPAPPQRPAARGRVMVVDDSLTVRRVTGRLLVREGYEVLSAKDGIDALDQLAEVVPDVMLLDVEMPRMDGFDLVRRVRADARLARVPIIMITSRSAGKHRSHALQLGVDAFLGKPYQETELLGRVASLTAGGLGAPAVAAAS